MKVTPKAITIDYFKRGYILDWPDMSDGWSRNGIAKNHIFLRLVATAL